MITQAPETVSKDWLRAVAGVINGTETLSTLDDFSEWTE
jgi:hypothetical protein